MKRTILIAAVIATGAVALPAAAQGHVTLQPDEAPAGGFARLDVRVPNEEDDKATTKVVVQMPPGFADASYEPVPGWRVKETTRKLPKPIKTDDGDTLTEELAKITFTAAPGKGIEPGQFQDFGLSVGLPDKPGTKLTFKALQTYEGGEVVRWIGAADSEKPAPQVSLVAAAADEHGGTAFAPAEESENAGDSEDEDDGNGLAIIALIVGGLGLAAGGAALATRGKAA